MGGNLWEWTADVYDQRAYERSLRDNPRIEDGSAARVRRGGSWNYTSRCPRCSNRKRLVPEYQSPNTGFCLALEP